MCSLQKKIKLLQLSYLPNYSFHVSSGQYKKLNLNTIILILSAQLVFCGGTPNNFYPNSAFYAISFITSKVVLQNNYYLQNNSSPFPSSKSFNHLSCLSWVNTRDNSWKFDADHESGLRFTLILRILAFIMWFRCRFFVLKMRRENI